MDEQRANPIGTGQRETASEWAASSTAYPPAPDAAPQSMPEPDETRDGGRSITIYIHNKPHTFEAVPDNDTFIELYTTLTETQRRVIRLRQPHETNIKSCERAGIANATLSAWLWDSPDNARYSENFRRLWYSIRYPDDAVERMTYAAELLGERNLWRLEGIAKLADNWQSLEKVDKVEARKATERLAMLPFERRDKVKEQEADGIVQAWLRLLANERAKIIEGKVLETEVVP